MKEWKKVTDLATLASEFEEKKRVSSQNDDAVGGKDNPDSSPKVVEFPGSRKVRRSQHSGFGKSQFPA